MTHDRDVIAKSQIPSHILPHSCALLFLFVFFLFAVAVPVVGCHGWNNVIGPERGHDAKSRVQG
jgi:hypothetical protein